jgi:ribonuclease P protein component
LPATGKSPQRLRKRAEFLAVRRGDKRRGRLFLLEVLDRGDEGAPRVGFTVTRKVGNAVERNRIRRRLREVVRQTGATVIRPYHDYVMIGRRAALDRDFATLLDDLRGALARLETQRTAASPPPRRSTRRSASASSSPANAADGDVS